MTPRSLPPFLRAFHSSNYRLFFAGQVISLVGTWMTQTASLWLAYHLESSALLLGLVGFSSQAPIFFLAPVSGVWIDRLDHRRLLLVTQALSLVQSGVLAACALTGSINIWGLVGLSLLQGVINAFDIPCRQAFVIQLVDRREDLGNAIALNSSMFNLARLVGPAIGGFVIQATSAGICYLVDSVSYVAVLISLFFIRPRRTAPAAEASAMGAAGRGTGAGAGLGGEAAAAGAERAAVAVAGAGSAKPAPRRGWADLREGWAYAFGYLPIRSVMILVASISFTGFAATVLLPVFARDIFGGDAKTLGALMSATGIGALGGALYLSTRSGVRGLGQVMVVGGSAMGIGLIGCALCHVFWLAEVALVLTGAGGVLLMASGNTILQSLTEDRMRGRVLSLFAMAFTGTAPLGNLAAGALASAWLGAERTMMVCGAACLVAVAAFAVQLPRIKLAAAPAIERMERAG